MANPERTMRPPEHGRVAREMATHFGADNPTRLQTLEDFTALAKAEAALRIANERISNRMGTPGYRDEFEQTRVLATRLGHEIEGDKHVGKHVPPLETQLERIHTKAKQERLFVGEWETIIP